MCFFLFFEREREGLFYGQMGMGMYEMTVICLDDSKNAFVVCRSFYEMVYEMRETHRKKKWAAGQNFYGEEKLGGWDLWVGETSHYLLPPRYKVCMIETERVFIFIFTFTFIYFCFFFSKGFNQILMYCPEKKRKRKERRKRKRTSSRTSDDR